MNTSSIKRLSGIALTVIAQAAVAEPITITSTQSNGGQISSPASATLKFSPYATSGMNAYNTKFLTGHEGASATIGHKTNIFTQKVSIDSAAYNLPVNSLTYDPANGSVLRQELQGSIKIAAPLVNTVFVTGGELTLSKLKLDQASKTIYATAQGANGVGTQENVAFWTYKTQSGGQISADGKIHIRLNELQLTASGFNIWSQSLGFHDFGPRSLATVNQQPGAWGNMTITVNTTGTVAPPSDPSCTTH